MRFEPSASSTHIWGCVDISVSSPAHKFLVPAWHFWGVRFCGEPRFVQHVSIEVLFLEIGVLTSVIRKVFLLCHIIIYWFCCD